MYDQSNKFFFRDLPQAATANPAHRHFSKMSHITGLPRADCRQSAAMQVESPARNAVGLIRDDAAHNLEDPFEHRVPIRDSLDFHATHCRRLARKPKLLQLVKDKLSKLRSKVHGAVKTLMPSNAGSSAITNVSSDSHYSQSEYSDIFESDEDEDPVDYSWVPRNWNPYFDLYRDETPNERFHRRMAMAEVHTKARMG